MDYLRIGENKLKITLTEEELLFYGMNLATLDYASTETRRAFWAILDDAKHATGFDAASAKVCVQIYASKTGGCEIFVTEVPYGERKIVLLEAAEQEQEQEISSCDRQTMALALCGTLPASCEPITCRFSDLSCLLTACKILQLQGYCGDSSVWQQYTSRSTDQQDYYLCLTDNRPKTASSISVDASRIVTEFGDLIPKESEGFLSEHCIPLVDHNAVKLLGELAV